MTEQGKPKCMSDMDLCDNKVIKRKCEVEPGKCWLDDRAAPQAEQPHGEQGIPKERCGVCHGTGTLPLTSNPTNKCGWCKGTGYGNKWRLHQEGRRAKEDARTKTH